MENQTIIKEVLMMWELEEYINEFISDSYITIDNYVMSVESN